MGEKDKRGFRIPVMVLTGPTAVGKTALSLALAHRVGAEIVSADSVQIYKHLDIGSAKISTADREGVPHHMIDIIEPTEAFSVNDYATRARQVIQEIWQRGHLPLVVGGTGLWIRAAVAGYEFPSRPDNPLITREELERRASQYGWDSLRRQLSLVDPESWERIDPNDHRRLIRALEVYLTTNRRMARTHTGPSPYRSAYWVLTRPSAELSTRIQERVQAMLNQGFEAEVLGLLQSGIAPRSQSLGAIGYRDMVDWYSGKSTSLERNALIVRHTRAYAKRQLTWWRAERTAHWLDLSAWTPQDALNELVKSAQNLIQAADEKG